MRFRLLPALITATRPVCTLAMTRLQKKMGPEAANKFLEFVNASPTPFHAVQNAALRLENAGFVKVWYALFLTTVAQCL